VTTEYIDAALVLLLGILSTAVLGVACANLAGMLGSRAVLRAKEIALRLAVGASRARLVRQLITESVMLALTGGVCGVAVGYAGIAVIQQIEYPSELVGRCFWA
jgi:ABC-type antimicrobial peptide transport system permease subunit